MASEIPSIGMQMWLKDAETQALMAALNADGAVARFVGGCVRNALMGEPVTDVDIATTDAPDATASKIEAAGFKMVPLGVDHGTVMAVGAAGRTYEVTTLRVDVETDGRRAEVAFTGDWQGDAERRDFTMNALYADADGTVHDPLGGYDDLMARKVRFIGDAAMRIEEDYLRILRFFRFSASYGGGVLDETGLKACADSKAGLAQLSAERVQTELLKLVGADHSVPVLRAMAAAGILADVLPEAARLDRFEKAVDIETTQLFSSDPVLRLGMLVDSAEAAESAARRLKLSNADRDRIIAMHRDSTKIVCYLSMREVRRALYLMGLQLFMDRVMLGWAEDGKSTNAFQWRALLAMGDSWEKPELPLTGSMMKAAGVPEGPEMGRVHREVEEWWIDSDFTDDEFSIIERLKAVVQATVY